MDENKWNKEVLKVKAVLAQGKCIKLHVLIVVRKLKCLLYPILIDRCTAESAIKTIDRRDINSEVYSHTLCVYLEYTG
ncbi:MAG: hypothetical protein C5S40_01370 [ANME-2 cluster archaeon]|nr:hypothetical protein [ANME-2 cluster archaeon]